jgi:hypothetical protein
VEQKKSQEIWPGSSNRKGLDRLLKFSMKNFLSYLSSRELFKSKICLLVVE